MGGIAGFFRVDNVSNSLLTAMAESMIHTKQDRVDTWSDDYVAISRVHHGVINSHKQPLFNAEASLLIFMEGEVFDYESQKKLLISKGYSFRFKDNDAEYCLHLYEEFGDEAFAQLNGSFLIVLYDLKAHRLLIVNDRFSSHALF
jgi:asparagine synthase (glutamine-hydrolysing)